MSVCRAHPKIESRRICEFQWFYFHFYFFILIEWNGMRTCAKVWKKKRMNFIALLFHSLRITLARWFSFSLDFNLLVFLSHSFLFACCSAPTRPFCFLLFCLSVEYIYDRVSALSVYVSRAIVRSLACVRVIENIVATSTAAAAAAAVGVVVSSFVASFFYLHVFNRLFEWEKRFYFRRRRDEVKWKKNKFKWKLDHKTGISHRFIQNVILRVVIHQSKSH